MSERSEVIAELDTAIDALSAAFNILDRLNARTDTQIEIGHLIERAILVRSSLKEKRFDAGGKA